MTDMWMSIAVALILIIIIWSYILFAHASSGWGDTCNKWRPTKYECKKQDNGDLICYPANYTMRMCSA